MSSRDNDFEDEIAGYLAAATVVVIAIAIVAVVAVVIGICFVLWEGYARYGRAGHPRANHLRAIGALAAALLLFALVVATQSPEAGFWVATSTVLAWVIRVWMVGKQEEEREKALLAQALDELSALEAYLAPFAPDAAPRASEPLAGEDAGGAGSTSRLHGLGSRLRDLPTVMTSGGTSLDGVFSYLFGSGSSDVVTQDNVRKILQQ